MPVVASAAPVPVLVPVLVLVLVLVITVLGAPGVLQQGLQQLWTLGQGASRCG